MWFGYFGKLSTCNVWCVEVLLGEICGVVWYDVMCVTVCVCVAGCLESCGVVNLM